jgi:hypothetical protein
MNNVVTSFSLIYRLSIKKEILHFDELQSELRFRFCHGSKSSELVINFHTVSNHEEKEQCMKFLLFQLARIAEDKWVCIFLFVTI